MAAKMGKDGFVSLAGSTVATAYVDSWSLNAEVGTADVTGYGETAKSFIQTIRGFTVSCNMTLDRSDTGQDKIMQIFESTASSTGVSLRLYDDSTSYWLGSVHPTGMAINSQIADKVSATLNFQGSSNLSYITT